MLFLDTETCGLTGPIVLIQYAEVEPNQIFDRSMIQIVDVWLQPISQTLLLLEKIVNSEVVLFNLAFDWFHITKLYNLFKNFVNFKPHLANALPIDQIEILSRISEYWNREFWKNYCLKPKNCLDLWLYALQGPWQATMERKPIVIRGVPNEICDELIETLNQIDFVSPLLFARSSIPRVNWKTRTSRSGARFKDVYLKFNSSSGLKAFAKYVMDRKDIENLKEIFEDVPYPMEWLYAHHKCQWGSNVGVRYVPDGKKRKKIEIQLDEPVIKKHISHWSSNALARKYAADDIDYTYSLWNHFGRPALGDDNSILATVVGGVRYRGYSIDMDHLSKVRDVALSKTNVPTSPSEVKDYLNEVIPEGAKLKSTNKAMLERLTQACEFCNGRKIDDKGDKCDWCADGPNEIAIRAQAVIDARTAQKEVELYDKLLFAERFYASAKVIGSLSGRMSGTDNLNALGIKRDKYVRKIFTLTDDPNYEAYGGDFDSYEVSIAEAFYHDPELRVALMSGMKIHALFGAEMYGLTYEQVLADKGLYTKAKSGVFALIYGAMAQKLSVTLGIPLDKAEDGLRKFLSRFNQIGVKKAQIDNDFAALAQRQIGAKVTYKEPKEYIESMLGFPRYFTLENKFIEFLFNLANKLPSQFKKYNDRVVRKDREQTAWASLMTALYASAFGIQAMNQRASNNHVIQSTGSQITKKLQCAIWEHQPQGINEWIVQPFNVHDEILCVVKRGHGQAVKLTVDNAIKEFSKIVPLIAMEWKQINTWADK